MTVPVVIATRSLGKLWELRPMFAAAGIAVVDLAEAGIAESPDEEAVEQYETFEENALAKARYFRARTALPVVADDSGLEVAALGGLPGVRSKRWSRRRDLQGRALDAANNEKLLAELGRLGAGVDASARYVCVAAYVDGEREIACRGETAGRIVRAPRGSHGFGYDAHFESTDLGRTFGEAERAEKEVVSHRGRAFRALVAALGRAG